ncbi:MAG: hypothetical protein FP820_01950 [Sulfurimonas sp.]|jgi:hypothetical protein|nr:hypothetical protein [Sulfurimonas sp.]MBU1217194.1 hypothetical protein [bacterium]MBU1433980.1 hypothetical protein [bacterium]MBU1502962.1 hypothetical protein [bacterium]MBU3938258.1 hypothetical protein [bacterium]
MKNAAQILNSIQNKPQFSKLNKYKCIKKIESMFMPTFQRFVKFSYIKNDTLFFVLNHNAGKQEFDNSIQNIKKALNLYAPKECEELAIKDIKAFVTHTPTQDVQAPPQKVQKYQERSSGNFSIEIKDSRLNSLVRTIQQIIKEKNETPQ